MKTPAEIAGLFVEELTQRGTIAVLGQDIALSDSWQAQVHRVVELAIEHERAQSTSDTAELDSATVTITRSGIDSSYVINVDTDDEIGRVRVNINDGTVFDQIPGAIIPGRERFYEEVDREAGQRLRALRDHGFGLPA